MATLESARPGRFARPIMKPRDRMIREFFLGFIKIHLLHHAAEGDLYGLAMISELRRHGYELGPGSMYPILHELSRAGYLRRVERLVNGKVRKYYAITRAGSAALANARKRIAELLGEVLAPGAAPRRRRPRVTSTRAARRSPPKRPRARRAAPRGRP